ncbi:uncharacterized protein LOC111329704 isoform X1 [Stylophora pistillata]|uniref:uncharacterized protein LOC111329704 isoform X1 n=1 Tax=Stylophora pistillata TaxID=50429 RepID=UPI000C0423B3|nr:uncharacterized protein LOC111329704 isoform X1 [Stylophora pistillata]
MHLLISFLLLFGSLCRLVSAGPSPQWLYQQIHALPDNGNQHATTELHTKKSEIPPKRKDGVKRLFNFLDSAIQESGSGSGEGSADGRVIMATDQLVSSAGLKGKQSAGVDGHARTKKEKTTNSGNSLQKKTEALGHGVNEGQTSINGRKKDSYASISNLQRQFAASNRQGLQTITVPQQKTGYLANPGLQNVKYSPNVSSYSRSTYGNQRKTTGYSVAGQRAQLYGDAASSRRPPAIPVRSQVSASQGLRTQSLRPQNLIHGAPHRSNIQGPFYTTFTFTFPNSYQDYYRAKGIKSAEPLQENAYGQPQRQRNHFHQQVRALIPGRVPLAQPYNRYPYPASPAGVPGQTRGVIYSRFQYNPHSVAVSRARFPVFPRVVNTPPKAASFSGQVYYRNTIPNQQAGFSRNAQGSFHTYNYPLVQRPQVGRAVISRKPQPQIPMSALMAAGAKSLRQLSHG